MTNDTRESWITACADRYVSAGGADRNSAMYFAEACADSQESMHGPFNKEWDSPADAADEDMSYWESDNDQ